MSGRGLPSTGDTAGSVGHDALATAFSAFARSAHQQDGPGQTLTEVVRAAVDLVPGCDEGSISVVVGRQHTRSEAASGKLPRIVDELQERLQQGPCLDAVYREETVRAPDLRTETRWPEFAAAACAAGAAGMMSFQLFVEGDNLGALNLYARTAGAFDDESEHIGLMFAAHAAVAYDTARSTERNLRTIATRQLIGQAQGILMERHGLTAHQAFALLTKVSQERNLKLHTVADHLVLSGELGRFVAPPA